MANISPKLFQKVIQTGLKTALFTTSTAALMLSSSGALGAARTVTADGAELAAGTNIGPGAGAFVAGSTLQYTGAYTVTDADVSVRALDLNNFAAGLFSVTGDISLGSVVDTGGANKLPVSIDDGLTLTLTGTGTAAYGANPELLFQGGQAAANNTYTALGNIILNGANTGLTIASDPDVLGPITLAGTINGDADDHGELTVNTETNFTDVGVTNRLSLMTFNAPSQLTNVQVKDLVINNAAANVTVTGVVLITEKLNFVAAGQLESTNQIIGKAEFNADGTLILNDGISNTVTATANVGTLIIKGGNVADVGSDPTAGGFALKQVTFNNGNAGGGSTAGNIFATTVTIGEDAGNNASLVKAGAITGDVNFANAGTLTVNGGITGAVTTAGNAATGGTLVVTAGDITNVGIGGNTLTAVTFNNVAASNAGNIFATDITVGNAGTDVTTGTVNGAIDFAAAGKLSAAGLVTGTAVLTTDGQLTLGNGITGDITSVGDNGTVIVTAGDVQNVGDGGSSVKQLTFNNVAASNAGNIFATDITVGNAGTDVTTGTVNGAIDFAAAGKLSAAGLVTGTAVLTTDGQLTLGNGITGDITSVGDNGTVIVTAGDVQNVGDGGSSVKQLTFNNVAASNAGNIFATDITVGNAGTDVTTGTVNGAIDFAAAGKLSAAGLVTGTAVLTTDGQLTLGNGITGDITSVGDNGTVIVTAGDVQNVGDGGSSVKQLTFNNVAASNAGNIFATNVTVNSATANVAAGTVNGAINFAAAGKLNAGGLVTGTAVFNADGELTLGAGITGDVTTANAGEGTVIVTAGDIANAGTAGDKLAEVTFNNTVASNAGNIFATDVTVNSATADVAAGTVNGAIYFAAAGKLSVGGLVTGTTVFNADGTLTANNGITGVVTAVNGKGTLTTTGVGVTGAVGVNGASLKVLNAKVDNGAADLVFGSDIYAQTVNFDDVAGGGAVGTVQVGGNLIATNVSFSANANGGVLEFNGPLDGKGNVIPYDFKGTIANGDKATLNVNTAALTTFDPSIGTVQTINIKAGQKALIIDAGSGNVTLLAGVGQTINFADANSSLAFSNESNIGKGVAGTVKLAADLLSSGANQNRLAFLGGDANTEILNVTNNGGAVINVGNGGNTFTKLSILGFVATEGLNLAGVAELDVLAGANFVDKNNTAVNIATINIGAADADLGAPAAGAATYTIDTQGANAINILAGGKQIKFAHEDATLVLQNSAAGNGTITLNAALDPGAPNKGKLTVDSGAAGGKIILASANGATYGTAINKLKELELAGTGTFQIDTDIFGSDLKLSVPAITYNKDINSNLTFGANTALTQNGNINGNVDFNNQAAVITLGAGKNITGSVTSSNGVNGTIIASGASTINGPITNLAMLKVGAGAVSITTGGDTSITEIQGNGTEMLTLPADFKLTGAINATGGQALKLNFTNGGSVSGVVGTAANSVGDITTAGATTFTSAVNAKGTATLGGTTSFADTFTNTGAVTLAKASINNFAKDVTATSFKADGATMNFGNSLAFNSDITGSGTTITLGANQVTYTGTGSFTDTLNLNTTFDGAAKSGGNILVKSGGTLDLSGVSNLALAITTTNFDINNIDEDTKYTVVSAETAGGLKPSPAGSVKITVNNENRFIKFTFDTSTLTLFAEDVAEDVIEEDFAPGGPLANIPNAPNIKKSLELMEQAPNGSDARLAFGNWGDLTPIQEADAVSHLIQDVVKLSDVIATVNNLVMNHISSNYTVLNARLDRMQPANNLVAVGAGDEDENAKYGAWATPFIGNATQKKKGNTSGYKADSTGGTIGFDGLVCEDLVLGAAYTRADTDTKLKDNKTGDKNKVQSNIFSLYGLYNLPYDNFFVEGIVSYGDSNMRSKSRRVIATAPGTIAYQTANSKYKSESYTGQLMAGYTYAMPENINLTPLAGLRYSSIKDKGYKETGATYQNLIVKGKNYNSFDGLLGAKVSSNINVNEVVLTPELYAMVDYAFKNKVPAIDARLQGMTAPFPTNSFKQSKTSFDVGVGVTAKHKMMEYGINYDTNIGSKYFAQQGSVKVRVNF